MAVRRTSVHQAPGSGTLYPFTEPTTLTEHVLDFYLCLEKQPCDLLLPLALRVTANSVEVLDANDNVVVAAPFASGNTLAWGDRTVYAWQGPDWTMSAVWRGSASPATAALDPRTIQFMPRRVRRIRVGALTFSGNVVFQAGNNVLLETEAVQRTDGARRFDRITLHAIPGAGMGKLPGCDESVAQVWRINQVAPDASGNFRIELADCVRGQIPVSLSPSQQEATYVPHTLRLYQDCNPCYDCSYFIRTYRGVKRLWQRWKTTAQQAEQVRDIYENNRQRWLDQRDCRMQHPARLVTISEADCKTFVGGSYCNLFSDCITTIEFRFTFRKFKDGVPQPWPVSTPTTGPLVYDAFAMTEEDELEVRIDPWVVGPVVRIILQNLSPGWANMVKFRLCLPCEEGEVLETTLTIHFAGMTTPGPNHPPVLTVPSYLSTIWTTYSVPAPPSLRAWEKKLIALNPEPTKYPCTCSNPEP